MYGIQPRSVWLTVNRNCNFRCKWCYAEGTGYNTTNEMSFSLAKDLVRVVQEAGVRNLLIIGGEPTLWRPLIEFNDFCRREGIRTVLVTNGAYFGVDSFWRLYKKHSNNKIGLSLKASNPQQLYSVAGVRNFNIVRKGIIRAIQELETSVSITYNVFYVNILKDLVKFAVDCGARTVKIDFCSTTFVEGKAKGTYMVNPQQLVEDITRNYSELERITGGHIVFEMMIPFCLWPIDFIIELKEKKQILSVCHVLKRSGLIFDEFGRIIICNALFDYPIGSYGNEFQDGASLLKLLNSSKVTNYYNRIRRYPSIRCRSCRWYSDCGGGCPLRWAIYYPEEFVRPISEDLLDRKGGEMK